MYGYVYLTTNLVNGKRYIGLKCSSSFVQSYLGSGKLIQKAIKKYGKENFSVEVIRWCENKNSLIEAEIEEIKKYDAVISRDFYNMIDTKVPIMPGELNYFYGKTHTEETRKKMSEARTGIPMTEAWKESIRRYYDTEEGMQQRKEVGERFSGPLSEEHKQKIIDHHADPEYRDSVSKRFTDWYADEENYNRRWTDEARQAASERTKGIPRSDEVKEKISKAHKGTTKPWVSNVINKNPVKIEKMAAKHRGMKRGKEACENISEGIKRHVNSPDYVNPQKGKIWIHNPLTKERKMIRPEEGIPEGYKRGKGSRK